MASAGNPRRVLLIVENLPVPFDRRVWQEAVSLHQHGYEVSVICPATKGFEKRFEEIDGIHIYRHPMPLEARGAIGYMAEYASALFWETLLAWRIFFTRGFDVIHLANPPDMLFLAAIIFKLFGKRIIFDHHDICPELYEAKFNRRDLMYRMQVFLERCSFLVADVSIATNESYRSIAIERGRMDPSRVFVVRNGPDLRRIRTIAPIPAYRNGRKYLVGYVGVIEKQEGIDCLLRVVKAIVGDFGRTDIQFALVGGGTELDDLKREATELGVEEFVTFTGRVSDEVLVQVLNTADVCVNPDTPNPMNDKSTMTKIMEFMALGKPIVQFDLTEGRYSAQDASLYAQIGNEHDFAKKIVQLIDNPSLRSKMSALGQARALQELTWEHSVPKLLAAYETIFPSGK